MAKRAHPFAISSSERRAPDVGDALRLIEALLGHGYKAEHERW